MRQNWLELSEKDGFKHIPQEFTQDTLHYLQELCSELKRKYKINCQIDTSVVRSHEYYTGIVFEVDYSLDDRVEVEIAGGGRYNKLVGRFTNGKIPMIPATGFAYGVQRVSKIYRELDLQDNFKKVTFFLNKDRQDVSILSRSNNYYNAFLEAEKIRAKNKRANIYLNDYNKFYDQKKKYDVVVEVE